MSSVLLELDKDFLGPVSVWLLTVLFVQTDPESGQQGFRGTTMVKTQLNFCFACSKTAVTYFLSFSSSWLMNFLASSLVWQKNSSSNS